MFGHCAAMSSLSEKVGDVAVAADFLVSLYRRKASSDE